MTLDHEQGLATAWEGEGMSYAAQGDEPWKDVTLLRRSLEVEECVGWPRGVAMRRCQLAGAYSGADRHPGALPR